MKHLDTFKIFEVKSGIKFEKLPKKEGAKTESFNVIKDNIIIGLIKWSSRLRGYSFLPTADCSDEIKAFISDLMSKRRELNKKSSK